MAEATPLGRAAAMAAAHPDDDSTRLRLYEVLSGAELTLPLAGDGTDDEVEPVTVNVEGTPYVVAHDGPQAAGGSTATLSGLALASIMEGQGAGLALHLGDDPAPFLIPPAALDWLAGSLADGPERVTARPVAAYAPEGLPLAFLAALDRRIAQGEGLAEAAWLAKVDWSDGSQGYLLAFVDARPGSEEPLAAGVNAAVALSGSGDVRLDVTFLAGGDPAIARLARVGLRFDLVAVEEVNPAGGAPRLR